MRVFLTGKCLPIFPGFPVRVRTLDNVPTLRVPPWTSSSGCCRYWGSQVTWSGSPSCPLPSTTEINQNSNITFLMENCYFQAFFFTNIMNISICPRRLKWSSQCNWSFESNDIIASNYDVEFGRILATETLTVSPRRPSNLSNLFWHKFILACKVIIDKEIDWPPNYHKTARTFPRIFSPRHSMIKLCLTVDTHAEEIGEVFEHSDPYFVQILEESVKHRH